MKKRHLFISIAVLALATCTGLVSQTINGVTNQVISAFTPARRIAVCRTS